jgi:putative cell wall-binding protein
MAVGTLPSPGRLGGPTRYERSIISSRAVFPNGADTVIVTSGEDRGGSIVAATMANARNAPLLYTNPKSVSSVLATELRRLAPSRIVVVGVSGIITTSTRAALHRIAPVERIMITNRLDGSLIALADTPQTDTVYVTGNNLNHLAAASSAAAGTGRGALIVRGTDSKASTAVINGLRKVGAKRIVLVGTTSMVSLSYSKSLTRAGFSMSRVNVSDTYDLSRALAKKVGWSLTRAYVANPLIAWDVASATALAGVTGQPMVYAPYQCMISDTAEYLSKAKARVVAVGSATWLRSPILSNTACSVQVPKLEASLESKIRATASNYSGSYAVSVREIGRVGEAIHVNGGSRLEPASMMKLFAAWAALRRIERGWATSNTKPGPVTLGTCLRVMIHASDNACHTDIVHWIGIDNLSRLIADYGFTGTKYGSVSKGTSVLYAGNRSTSADLARFMLMLETGQLLEKRYADVLLKHMDSQIWTSRIASGIPPGIDQQSKPGALWVSGKLMQGDTAIIRGPQATFALSVVGSNGPDRAGIRAITRVVYTHFHGSFGSAASYPAKQMITTERVAVRTSAGGSVTGYLAKGTLVEITDAHRHWYKMWWGSRLVWADSRSLRNR